MSSPNQLSFLPDDYLERKARRRTNVVCASLFVLIVGSVIATAWFAEQSLKDVDARERAVDAQYAEAARRIEQVKQLNEKQQRMARQAELTDSLIERVPRSNLLAEIRNAMPEGMGLLELITESTVKVTTAPPMSAFEKQKLAQEIAAGHKPASEPPRPKQYDVRIKLTGVADTDVQVAQYITRLNVSKLLADVNLLISDEYTVEAASGSGQGGGEKARMRKFQIEMALRADAEVKPAEEPSKTAVSSVDADADADADAPLAGDGVAATATNQARRATAAANQAFEDKTAAVETGER